MSVFRYEPFYNLDRLFDVALNGAPHQRNSRESEQGGAGDVQRLLKPRMDLHENTDSNTVTASFEFPGLKKEDIQLDLHNDALTVSGETKISNDHEENGYAVRERRYGRFSRTLQLPRGVKEEEVKAAMQDGVLTITFPKLSTEAAPKKISIS